LGVSRDEREEREGEEEQEEEGAAAHGCSFDCFGFQCA
jgi:hypothetical protein